MNKGMSFLLAVILTAVLAAVAEMFLPWWSMCVAAFIVGFAIPQKRVAAWMSAVVAIFALWLFYALYLSSANDGILVNRVAELFGSITGGKSFRVFFLTAAIGSLAAGFSALTGRLLGVLVSPKQQELQ